MTNYLIRKEVRIGDVHEDIIKEMISEIPGINNFADAVRYSILSMKDKNSQQKRIADMERKLNSMSKQIDILVEMMAGGLDQLDVKAIGKKEDTYVYQDAKKNVENNIQRSTTEKQQNKNKQVSFSRKRELI